MACYTLTNKRRFPDTTEVKAYPVSNWPASVVDESAGPVGTEADTQTMTSGTLTFTDLDEGERYVAHAEVGGVDRYVHFTPNAEASTFVPVNADSDGDNTVVAAVTGKKIRVLGYALVASGAGTITVKSASTVLAEFTLDANGGVSYTGSTEAPAFETAAGEALVLNNPNGVDTNGHLVYRQA